MILDLPLLSTEPLRKEPRIILASNRIPITITEKSPGDYAIETSSGGLASAVGSLHTKLGSSCVWVGWPGPANISAEDLARILGPMRFIPVSLSAAEVASYYENFSNGVLWPVCHGFLDKVMRDVHDDWEVFRAINERFADVIASQCRPNDIVWIHDCHLMLVPEILRAKNVDVRIGYFHHIPFPSAEVFRTIPWCKELLLGLLGADVLGFHTPMDVNQFLDGCKILLGLIRGDHERIILEDRCVEVGCYPVGIDAEAYSSRVALPEVLAFSADIREKAKGRKIVLAIDRLDYSKGLVRRLLAIERFLTQHPELIEQVHFIQVAVPSREKVEAYVAYRSTVNELVGRINSKFGTTTQVVIHLIYRSVSPTELSALYSAAEVMMVTPLRDGMNLVCKEYVASRTDNTGVLVLSKFAGAAFQLRQALLVNPYDLDNTSNALFNALHQPVTEQQDRMSELRKVVHRDTISWWGDTFLENLKMSGAAGESPIERIDRVVHRGLLAEIRVGIQAQNLLMILDYDGTLVEFSKNPAAAIPSRRVLNILSKLCCRPGTEVHIVSGRPRDFLEAELGNAHSNLCLHAEHGVFSRTPSTQKKWVSRLPLPPHWFGPVLEKMNRFAGSLAEAFVEIKSAAICFHYRAAEAKLAETSVKALNNELLALDPAKMGFELLHGSKVLEARSAGISKGTPITDTILPSFPSNGCIIAIGDDVTDEDMFAALPPTAITVHVGDGDTRARFHVPDVVAVKKLLRCIATEGSMGSF